MNNRKKIINFGFTIPELVIILTVLAVFGTMFFISVNGYNTNARNSKRTIDLASISKGIELLKINGTKVSSAIKDTSSTIQTNIQIAGKAGYNSLSGSYIAGDINYRVLGLDDKRFLDPKSNSSYKLGYTTYGGKYELATTIELRGDVDSLVKGDWEPRKSSTARGTRDYVLGNKFYFTGSLVTGLRVGDSVRVGSSTKVYEIIGMEGQKITLDKLISPSGASIYLNSNETRHLIKKWDSDYAIKVSGVDYVAQIGEGYTNTPYYY